VGIIKTIEDDLPLDKCSTPFGITEVGIPYITVGQPDKAMVLNAFRHHRGGHMKSVRRLSRRF